MEGLKTNKYIEVYYNIIIGITFTMTYYQKVNIYNIYT